MAQRAPEDASRLGGHMSLALSLEEARRPMHNAKLRPVPGTARVEGMVLTPGGFIQGALVHAQGRVLDVTGRPVGESEARAAALPLVLPGFVDLHVHGGGGKDVMEGAGAIETVARLHARHGTTAFLATTMTASHDELHTAIAALAPACTSRPKQAAFVLGVHLEGPFINPAKLGAQPPLTREASMLEIELLNGISPIRLITLAPELPGVLDMIPLLRRSGYRVQIGHTAGSYEEGVAALQQGARGFTHLFNAMSGLHHREPGMVGAALSHATAAEVIPDLLHVHPGAIRVALRCIPRLYCVTDSTAAAGMPDGNYMLGRHRVAKCLGGVRLPDGTLAGSALTMDQALRNLVSLGLDLADASRRVSTFAADHIGLADHGRLQPGAWANLVVLDPLLRLQRVIVEGEEIDLMHV
jgi:N-acetylglucosamine-6-phosphate deacetylase